MAAKLLEERREVFAGELTGERGAFPEQRCGELAFAALQRLDLFLDRALRDQSISHHAARLPDADTPSRVCRGKSEFRKGNP